MSAGDILSASSAYTQRLSWFPRNQICRMTFVG